MLAPDIVSAVLSGKHSSERTRPVTAAEAGVDSARSIVMGAGYAAAFSWRACFQFQGRSSSIRLAG
jgi:hypothetical protein